MTSSAWTETIYLLALRTQWPGACLFAFCSVYLPACIGHGPWVSEFAGLVAALHGRLSQLLAAHVDDRVSQCLAQAEPDLLWNFLGTSTAPLASATLSTLLPLFAKLPVLCFLRLPLSSSSSSSFSLLCCRRRCAPSSAAFAWLDPQTSHSHIVALNGAPSADRVYSGSCPKRHGRAACPASRRACSWFGASAGCCGRGENPCAE